MNSIATVIFLITLPVSTLTSFAEEFNCGAPDSPRAVECHRREVKDFLQSWVHAWGSGDADNYIEHYSPFSSPREGMSRGQWEADRRARIGGNNEIVVTLELDSMGISQDGTLDVIFIQSYQSANYKDVVKKQLFLKREDGGLRIQREITVD